MKYILLCALLIAFVLWFFISKNNSENLRKRMKYTYGVIDGINSSARSGHWCNYSFKLNGKDYLGSIKLYIREAECQTLIGKNFPVIYDSNDVSNNEILILPEHFSRFSIPYPDSLYWILQLKN